MVLVENNEALWDVGVEWVQSHRSVVRTAVPVGVVVVVVLDVGVERRVLGPSGVRRPEIRRVGRLEDRSEVRQSGRMSDVRRSTRTGVEIDDCRGTECLCDATGAVVLRGKIVSRLRCYLS